MVSFWTIGKERLFAPAFDEATLRPRPCYRNGNASKVILKYLVPLVTMHTWMTTMIADTGIHES